MLSTHFLVVFASSLVSAATASTFGCGYSPSCVSGSCSEVVQIKYLDDSLCKTDSDCENDNVCGNEDGVNYCMPAAITFEEPLQVTDSVHINGTSTAVAPTGTTTASSATTIPSMDSDSTAAAPTGTTPATSATSATTSPSMDSDRTNCGVVGKVCESFESCVLGACDSSTIQYTPDVADWTKMNEMALAENEDHTPDGAKSANFTAWDGVPRKFQEFSSKKIL
jgi:hypothetical protein